MWPCCGIIIGARSRTYAYSMSRLNSMTWSMRYVRPSTYTLIWLGAMLAKPIWPRRRHWFKHVVAVPDLVLCPRSSSRSSAWVCISDWYSKDVGSRIISVCECFSLFHCFTVSPPLLSRHAKNHERTRDRASYIYKSQRDPEREFTFGRSGWG